MATATPECDWRDSEQYVATNHAQQEIHCHRSLTGVMVEEAIEEGEVTGDGDDGAIELRHKHGSMTFEVVINPREKVVITACEAGRSFIEQ